MTPDAPDEKTNLPATRPSKPALPATGGQPMAIIPRTVEEMMRLANAIAGSGLAPRTMQQPQQVMVAIMAGAELGMPPWQSVQSFAVIGNRATIWGDAIPALLWREKFKIKEWFEGSPYDDDYTARCLITRPDGTEIEGEFSVGDAKEAKLWTKEGPWQTAKKRMLKMRARAFAARDGAADVLRGMPVQEEVADYAVDTAPTQSRELASNRRQAVLDRMAANQHEDADTGFDPGHVAKELVHDAETGEVVEAEFEDAAPPAVAEPEAPEEEPSDLQSGAQPPAPSEPENPLLKRADDYERRLRAAPNTTKLGSIRNANAKLREALEFSQPERLEALDTLFNDLWAKLENEDA